MKKFALIGHQISYSKSPNIHSYMSKHLKIDFSYDLLDVTQDNLDMLIIQLKNGLYDGFNVTKPYKEIIMNYVDELTDEARIIGAVNTVYLRHNKIVGDNTDYEGFKGLIKRNKIKVLDKHIYILGTGGAAKACYHVLKDLEAIPTFVTRDALKVNQETIMYKDLDPKDVDIYVQATPVGTYPYHKQSIIDKSLVKNKYVIDLVYRPVQTKILTYAKNGVNGVDMLMIQALKSLSIWLEQDIKLTPTLYKKLKDVIISE
jgi:shikimate dehydrogenase